MDVQNNTLPDLAIARQKSGVSLAEIAADTKIAASYLRAIEEGVFDRLPGGIYTVSYIRQYARAIDYDEDELVRYYYRVTGTEPPQEPPTPASKASSGPLARWARVLG
ncbi:MAG TPA: helix-turn-helix domain-containing protein [Bryobacteraceae bacterium]|nr:helix-turn-helix domain-containing protein [Bryobacteraceae bacterium]